MAGAETAAARSVYQTMDLAKALFEMSDPMRESMFGLLGERISPGGIPDIEGMLRGSIDRSYLGAEEGLAKSFSTRGLGDSGLLAGSLRNLFSDKASAQSQVPLDAFQFKENVMYNRLAQALQGGTLGIQGFAPMASSGATSVGLAGVEAQKRGQNLGMLGDLGGALGSIFGPSIADIFSGDKKSGLSDIMGGLKWT